MKLQAKAIDLLNTKKSKNWLITGVAGFIGSNIAEALLAHNQTVIGVDNLSTGNMENLEKMLDLLPNAARKKFHFIKGSILDQNICDLAVSNSDVILHHAAKVSVPESITDPSGVSTVNIIGTLNMLRASVASGVERFVYASSSAVYGDLCCRNQGILEELSGNILSPYGLSKKINEMHATYYSTNYNIKTIGLRYFNIYGPNQNPNGMYAAVIAKWIRNLKENKKITIYGDGFNTRDFCFVGDVVSANILSGYSSGSDILNIGTGTETTINQLADTIFSQFYPNRRFEDNCNYDISRTGEIKESVASIKKAREILDFDPIYDLKSGLSEIFKL